ncbi:MAG: fibronectin type III domain-containing protein, partial [Methanobacteriota archaeon]
MAPLPGDRAAAPLLTFIVALGLFSITFGAILYYTDEVTVSPQTGRGEELHGIAQAALDLLIGTPGVRAEYQDPPPIPPSPRPPNAMIACYWEDLVAFSNGQDFRTPLTYGFLTTAPQTMWVRIEWAHYNHSDTSDITKLVVMEIHLLQNGDIECLLETVLNDFDGRPTASGIEDQAGSVGVRYKHGEFGAANVGFRFRRGPPAANNACEVPGPDAGGYVCEAATVLPLGLSGSGSSSWFGAGGQTQRVDLPFRFTFYGRTYQTVFIGGEGLLCFVESSCGAAYERQDGSWRTAGPAWEANPDAYLWRLGLLQPGSEHTLKIEKFMALRNATNGTNATNNAVDLQQFLAATGLTGYNISLRTWPLFGNEAPGAVDDLWDTRFAYLGEIGWTGTGPSGETSASMIESGYLDRMEIGFENVTYDPVGSFANDASWQRGDKYALDLDYLKSGFVGLRLAGWGYNQSARAPGWHVERWNGTFDTAVAPTAPHAATLSVPSGSSWSYAYARPSSGSAFVNLTTPPVNLTLAKDAKLSFRQFADGKYVPGSNRPPGPPTITTVSNGTSSIQIAWNAPADTGGGNITGYYAYRRLAAYQLGGWVCPGPPIVPPDAQNLYRTLGNVTNHVDANVASSSQADPTSQGYCYSLTAVNSFAESTTTSVERLGVANATARVPGAPVNVIAADAIQKLVVSWLPPFTDGNSTISQYRVYRAQTATCAVGVYEFQASTTSTFFESTNVTVAVPYCFEVRAVNGIGEGAGQRTTGPATPTTPPPPCAGARPPTTPLVVQASPGDDRLNVSWTTPSDPGCRSSGGAAVISTYRLNVTGSGGGVTSVLTGPVTYYIVAGLSQAQTYTINVAAHNDNGVANANQSYPSSNVVGGPRGPPEPPPNGAAPRGPQHHT